MSNNSTPFEGVMPMVYGTVMMPVGTLGSLFTYEITDDFVPYPLLLGGVAVAGACLAFYGGVKAVKRYASQELENLDNRGEL